MGLRWSSAAAGLAASALLLASAPAVMAGPYFDGKEVKLIVPNTAAGTMSQYAHTLAPMIAKNLGASIRVENQPGAGSLKGTNVIWNSKPDGLTFGFTNVPTLLVAQIAESPGAQFKATDFTFLGRAAADPRLLLVGGSSEIKSMQDLLDLDRPFVVASQGTDEDFYSTVVICDALDIDMKIVTGYEGAADTALAVIKGDADGQMTGWAASLPMIKNNELRPIVFVTPERQEVAPDVPTVNELLKDETKKKQINAISAVLTLSRGFFGPPNMDPVARDELRAAIEKTLTDPAVVEEMNGKGMPIVFLSGAEQEKLAKGVFESAADLTPLFKDALAKIQ